MTKTQHQKKSRKKAKKTKEQHEKKTKKKKTVKRKGRGCIQRLYDRVKSLFNTDSTDNTLTKNYIIAIITTHAEDKDIEKTMSELKNNPVEIVRTGPVGYPNYCDDTYLRKMSNLFRSSILHFENDDSKILESDIFNNIVSKYDEEWRLDEISGQDNYLIETINENYNERIYQIKHDEIPKTTDANNKYMDSVLVFGDKDIEDITDDIEKTEHKLKNDQSKTFEEFTLTQVIETLKKLKGNDKKIIIIDYGCSGDCTSRGARAKARSRTLRKGKKINPEDLFRYQTRSLVKGRHTRRNKNKPY